MTYLQNCDVVCEVAAPHSNAYKRCGCGNELEANINSLGFSIVLIIIAVIMIFKTVYKNKNYGKTDI